MRYFIIIAILLGLPSWSASHPLHLSVTNITLENGTLSISMKTFLDDWETAYFHYHSKVIDLSQQQSRENPWFSKYLNDRFKLALSRDGEGIPLSVDTVMLEENAMTVEMHSEVVVKANSLYIYNALLTDIYPDQTNLVIFGFKKRETGIKFDVRKHDAEVKLN